MVGATIILEGWTFIRMAAGTETTPILMRTEYVTVVDNALAQMHVLVYRRGKDAQGRRKE
jgi:hypothetical protein